MKDLKEWLLKKAEQHDREWAARAGTDLAPHDFRSAAISNLFGKVEESVYYNLFGHRNKSQTEEYVHESADETRKALSQLTTGMKQ